jgi:hypothetical protein
VAGAGSTPHAGVFVLVQTTGGATCGGFCDRPLVPTAGGAVEYSGSKGCFVFTLSRCGGGGGGGGGGQPQGKGREQGVGSIAVSCNGGVAAWDATVYRWSGLNQMFWRACRSSGTAEQR